MIVSRFGEQGWKPIRAFIKGVVNEERLTCADLEGVPRPVIEKGSSVLTTPDASAGLNGYTKCMIRKVQEMVKGLLATATIIDLIKKKAWKPLANILIKFIGKSALRSNAVVIACSLAYESLDCLWEA